MCLSSGNKMKRIISFIPLLVFCAAAYAQVNTAGKGTVSQVRNPVVEITASAIPFSQAGTIEIDSSTYHKAVGGADVQAAEVTAAAHREDMRGPGPVKKESIRDDGRDLNEKGITKQKTVEVKAAADRR
jgi:hypothetical protein